MQGVGPGERYTPTTPHNHQPTGYTPTAPYNHQPTGYTPTAPYNRQPTGYTPTAPYNRQPTGYTPTAPHNHQPTAGGGVKSAGSGGHTPAWAVSPRVSIKVTQPRYLTLTPAEPTLAPAPAATERAPAAGYRFCWGLIYAVLLGMLALQLYTAGSRFLEGSITQHWDVQELERIPVPAITICHGNMFKKEVVLRSTVNGTTWADWIRYGPRLLRWGEVDFDSFYWNASYRWSDMVASCYVRKKTVQSANCSSAGTFYETATHLSGLCTTFASNITVREQHIGSQIQLTLMEESATGPHEHAGWHVYFHAADVRFTDVTMFTGLMDQVLVSPGRIICLDLTPAQVTRKQRWCSSRPNALTEYEACVVEQIRVNINATTEGPCQLPSYDGPSGSCTSFRDYLIALAIPEDQLVEPDFLLWSAGHACWQPYVTSNLPHRWPPAEEQLVEPDFLLWSAGHACRQPCNTHRFRTDAQQSLWLGETQQLLLQPQLVGRTTALLRLRLANGRERLTEQEAYPLDAFVADVGGHLGLLLGGSVLALLQMADRLGRAARRRLRR